ncbi:hypothetical protein CYMTET_44994 [Cymbomonas tetramitiformis]|uniref:Uncharacterized protein n=1 Tax=Cymbomonas tetramitiformis TaxID=36881 RepID=A0AAE0C0B9_9CHLO|nr:hypothetical protein CYMTET_44994 [Cymbomonas tetramitiformis]
MLLDSPFYRGMISSYRSAVSEIAVAMDPDTRRAARKRAVQLLSLVAPHFPYAVVEETFQCSHRAVYNARLHAAHNGGGDYVPKRGKQAYKSRVSLETLTHFVQFKTRDDVVTTVAYTRADKTQTVEKYQLQEGVQDLAQKYFRECALMHVKPVSISVFEKIFYAGDYVNKTARTCVCHQDLFYGTENFEAMESCILSLTDSLIEHSKAVSCNAAGVDQAIPLFTPNGMTAVLTPAIQGLKESLLAMLKRVRTYYRTDFNVHAQAESTCATHCVQYALSNSADPRFQTACSHTHSMSCPDCNLAIYFVKEMQSLLKSACNVSVLKGPDLERLTFALEECEAHLSKYVGHRVRTVHQHGVPGAEMASMGYCEAYIIMDYMNKWLPLKHMATTSDAFGQAGESVHGATVYVHALPQSVKETIASGELEDPHSYIRELKVDSSGDINRWYVLLGSINDHKQDQWHALSVLEATLKIVKEIEPQVDEARLRFDNAPCYHGTLFWLMVSIMEKATGIQVTEVGMNEPGEGKDETDSSFNTAKAYVRRLVNQGKLDAKTAVDFIAALNTGQCVEGMVARVVEICRDKMPADIGTLDQITRYSHFRHEEGGGLRCWEQYMIGEGRLFSPHELKKLCKEALPVSTGVFMPVGDSTTPKVEAKVKEGRRALDLLQSKRQEATRKREAKAAAIEAGVLARRQFVEANRTTSSCPVPGCRHAPFLRLSSMQQHTKTCNPPPPPPIHTLSAAPPTLRSYRPEISMDISMPTRLEAMLSYESTSLRQIGVEYDPYACELYGLDAALLLSDVEVGDGNCGGKWTLILASPQRDLIPMGYAVKARVTPQQKTEVQLQMLEEAFQRGLERGGGRSSRASDDDVLQSINAVSIPQKQLRLDQVSSWFSRRYSKYVLEGKNARVRAEIELARTTRVTTSSMVQSIIWGFLDKITDKTAPRWLQSEAIETVDQSVLQTEDEGMEDTTGVEVACAPGIAPAENRRLRLAQSKERAASLKRKATCDVGQEHLVQLKTMAAAQRVRYVKKLKVEPLKGLLMCLQEQVDELPSGKKAEHLAAVLAFVDKMESESAPQVASSDVEMQSMQPAEIVGAQAAQREAPSQPASLNDTVAGIVSELDQLVEEQEADTLSAEAENELVLSFLNQFSIS